MAYSFENKETDIVSAQECTAYYENDADLTNHESILEHSAMLARLANNKQLLQFAVERSLENLSNGIMFPFYSPQSFIIGSGINKRSGRGFTLRGNLWKPMEKNEVTREPASQSYSYYNTHDHNFDLLTVGYTGSGYTTEIYEYDNSKVVGYVGEKVDIEFLERTKLDPSKIMLFRRSQDIHTQLYPDELSISFNLVISDNEIDNTAQYEFDIENSCISSLIFATYAHPWALIELCGDVGNENVIEQLIRVTKTDPLWQRRFEAIKSILKIKPSLSDQMRELAEKAIPLPMQESLFAS